MNSRYSRNRIYISAEEQNIIKDYPILLGGSGIGSNIAECALRLGFENITIIDGDEIEESNLNRQNYTEQDIGLSKVETIVKRLKLINPNSTINCHNCFLDEHNIVELIQNHKIAINALDFDTNIPLLFDELCQIRNIPVLHPYNLGWGALVTVISPDGFSLINLAQRDREFSELDMVKYASSYLKYWGNPQNWIDEVLEEYMIEKNIMPPPQLSIGSWLVAAICTHILFNIATNKKIRKFPEFYLSTIMNETY